MKIRFKKLDVNAVIPTRGTEFSAGWDLTAISKNETKQYIEYGTGLALEIPVGKVGLIFPRSSVTNKDLILKNSVGVIDSDYRGEIKFRFYGLNTLKNGYYNSYNIGERIGQIVFIDLSDIDELIESEELNPSVRGENGYGSTGK